MLEDDANLIELKEAPNVKGQLLPFYNVSGFFTCRLSFSTGPHLVQPHQESFPVIPSNHRMSSLRIESLLILSFSK